MSENQTTTSEATAKPELTKEQRIAAIDAQIKKLQDRRYAIENDLVVPKAVKVVVLPNVGDEVAFTYGRKTPTSEPRSLVGVVLGVKPAAVTTDEGGKEVKTPALVKVTVGEGFDAEVLTIYPKQITGNA